MRKIFYCFVFILFVVYGLLATEAGLQTLFRLAQLAIPGTLTVGNLQGTLLTPIEMRNLKYQTKNYTFKSAELILDFKIHSLLNNTIDIPSLMLRQSEFSTSHSNPIFIHQARIALKWRFSGRMFEVNIPEFQATWHNKPINLLFGLQVFDNKVNLLHNSYLRFGMNEIKITQREETLHYSIDVREPNFKTLLQGRLKPMTNNPEVWQGSLETTLLEWPIANPWKAKQLGHFQISRDKIYIEPMQFSAKPLNYKKMHFKELIASFSGTWEKQSIQSHFELRESAKNFIQVNLIANKTLQGWVKGQILEPHLWNSLFPEITLNKGNMDIQGKFHGNPSQPKLNLNISTHEAQLFIPKRKLNIQKLNFSIQGDVPGPLTLQGSGVCGVGLFNFNGNTNIFKTNDSIKENSLLNLNVKGHDLKLADQDHMSIIASPDLILHYEKNKLFIDGNIKIDEANITVQDQLKHLTPSADTIVIKPKSTDLKSNYVTPFKIVPNIQFIFENKTKIKAYGLEASVYGTLLIQERLDGLLTGSGRLTIQEGKYRFQGKNRYIHRGRLLFPQGTLLNNPILDIKITEGKIEAIEGESDASIYVQGTLQKPIYQLHTTSNMTNHQILSKLGLNIEEGSAKNSHITKSASLLASSNPIVDKLSAFLGLEELSVSTKQTETSQQNLSKSDTVLVVSKWLTNRIYIQYFQSVLEPISTAKIRYRLNEKFTAGIESGTEGSGADLIFSVEKD